jgi:hypothetical protein
LVSRQNRIFAVDSSTHSSVAAQSTPIVGIEDDLNYRAPSVLSIVSLILGLVAPLAFFAPLLMVIPITGAILALMAIRQIGSSEGTLIGRPAAMIGLVMSVACIAAVFARSTVVEMLLSRQAQSVAVEWFDALQAGDAASALKLTTASRQQPPKTPPGTPDIEAEPTASPLETFRADPVVHFLMEHARGGAVKYVRDGLFDPAMTSNARIEQTYEVDVPATEGGNPSTRIELVMQRVRDRLSDSTEWQVAAYRSEDLPVEYVHDHAGHMH